MKNRIETAKKLVTLANKLTLAGPPDMAGVGVTEAMKANGDLGKAIKITVTGED